MSNHTAETFKLFYGELVEKLPMNDAVFVANLYSNDFLPGDLKNQLSSLKTSADKATLFLDSVIKPSVTSDGSKTFDKLLNVMEGIRSGDFLKDLAKQIRTSLRKRSSSDIG